MEEKRRGTDPVRPSSRTAVPRRLNFARAGGLLLGIELFGTVVGFLSTVYFATELGAARLGVFFLFEAVLSTLATFGDFGIRGAVEKRISEGTAPRQILGAAILLKVGLIGVLGVVVVLFRDVINGYVGADVALLLVVTTLLYELSTLTVHVLRAELRADETAVLYFLRLVTYVVVAVVLLQFGLGVWALLYGVVAGYVVLLVAGATRVSIQPAVPAREHVASLVDYAKFNGIWGLGGHIYNTMDLLVIGFFLSSAHVAGYELAWRVTLMTAVVGGVVANTVFAQLSAWNASGEVDAIRTTLRNGTTAALFLVVPSFAGVALLSEELLGLVFGPEYVLAAAAFVVLMGEKVVAAVNIVLDAAVRAVDRPDIGAGATVLSLTLNVVLNLVLVPRYGLVGGAAATGLAMAVNTAALWWFLRRIVPVEFAARDLGWCVGAAGAMAGTLLLVGTVVPATTLPRLLGLVALGGVVYLGVVVLSPSLRGSARRALAQFGE
ncbi:lipopolysaccharide biosynthesis protein [Halomicroarcula sp. GCM10025709]|uniref:lipopolysaccharide biosynthesis protein n=1 Tax=Haloarcula TaxID=2237 RepID=UPI0024C41D89|nr:polysaccharide biosynthesis C-terminal domain-containing protein [Halomicroarcula sp. YJ-61-S]